MRVVATGDVHSPRYLPLLLRALANARPGPDLVVLAGDLVERNRIEALRPVYEKVLEFAEGGPVVSVFGNEEYKGFEEAYAKSYPKFHWLNDSYVLLDVGGTRVGVVGTRGALERPTPWQAKHVEGIEDYYRSLPSRMRQLIREARSAGAEKIIFVSHYGVTYSNLFGEPASIWPYLASRAMGAEVAAERPDVILHAHAHLAAVERVELGGVPVYNVSLPGRRKLVELEL
ncbi:MAG: metallophosphoesterase [Desulfurococcaceae archaeon]